MTSEASTKKTTLLKDETFEQLRQAQRRVQEKTEFSPSLRLLINDVINESNLEQSVQRIIGSIQNSGI